MSAFLNACRRESAEHIPVWFMRQAGRYQPEYRAIREKFSLLKICRLPEICAEVTLLPVRQLDVDAGILFSDITLPLEPMGVDFEIVEGRGPVIYNPVKSVHEVKKLKSFDAEESLPYVGETIRILQRELEVPLIGFVGAPFTLASYMIEGGPSKNFYKTKSFMYEQPAAWHELLDKLSRNMSAYLQYQVKNGCQALQVFDSWVGNLSYEDYMQYVFPHTETLFSSLKDLEVPLIHFGVMTGHLLRPMYDCGATVIGLDWRVEIAEAWERLHFQCAIQGNLDPAVLLAPWKIIKERINYILRQVDRPGFIFNLGHGIMPQASGDTLKRIVDYVHAYNLSTHPLKHLSTS